MALLFLSFALGTALSTLNLFFPWFAGQRRSVLSWLAGLLSGELAPHAAIFQLLVSGGFVLLGALEQYAGQLALALMVASWIGQAAAYGRSLGARYPLEAALGELDLGADLPRFPALREVLQPLPLTPPEVEHLRGAASAEHASRARVARKMAGYFMLL